MIGVLGLLQISASDMAGRYTYSSESVRNLWGAMDAAGSSRAAEAGVSTISARLPGRLGVRCLLITSHNSYLLQ